MTESAGTPIFDIRQGGVSGEEPAVLYVVRVPTPLFKLPKDKGLSVASAPVVEIIGLQSVVLHSADKGLRATGVDFGARQGGGSEISPIVAAGSSSSDGIDCQPLPEPFFPFFFLPSESCPHNVAGWLFCAHLLH